MEFVDLVQSAYENLYDLVYLRSHPLVERVSASANLSRAERAWQLHHALLQAIDELDPGPEAPTFSHEWRRHHLMLLRYVQGLDPPSVASQISVGLRHYYREQRAAIEAVARVLGDRYPEPTPPPQAAAPPIAETGQDARVELLRTEAARSSSPGASSSLQSIVEGVGALLDERMGQRDLRLDAPLGALPHVSIAQSLLRQLLLGLLGYLTERATRATIRVAARQEGQGVYLSLAVEPQTAVRAVPSAELREHLSAFEELAAAGGARLSPLEQGPGVYGLELGLPAAPQRTILVVDDNEDVLQLYERYLSLHQYRTVCARSAAEALELASRLEPQAITVDLMMPTQDGWDLLRELRSRADTRDIPVIVCSVLRQRELALSLGASAFLQKPITEEALVAVLEALGGPPAAPSGGPPSL